MLHSGGGVDGRHEANLLCPSNQGLVPGYYYGVLGDNPMLAVHLLVTSTRPFGHQLLDEINPGKRGSLARRPDGRRHWTAERLL